jgi:CRP-like cAMP-binding protein
MANYKVVNIEVAVDKNNNSSKMVTTNSSTRPSSEFGVSQEKNLQKLPTSALIGAFWRFCVAFSVVIGIVVSPICSAFGAGNYFKILMFCDIMWSFNTTRSIANFVLRMKNKEAKKNESAFCSQKAITYLQFTGSLILCIPWEILFVTKFQIFVCFRLFRSYKLQGFIKPLIFVQSRILKLTCHQPVLRLIKIMLFIAIFAHIVACFYVVIGSSNNDIKNNFFEDNNSNTNISLTNFTSSSWIVQFISERRSDFGHLDKETSVIKRGTQDTQEREGSNRNFTDIQDIYLRALHMSLQSVLTVGFGESPPKSVGGNLLMLFLAFTGAVVYALMIASLTSVIKNVAAVSNSRQAIKEMMNYLERQNVSNEFQRKVSSYLRQVGRRFGGMTEFDINEKCLSPEMKEKMIQRSTCLLYNIPLFKSFGTNFCHEIAKKMRKETFMEGEALVQYENIKPRIILMLQGQAVGLSLKNTNVMKKYTRGSVIGLYEAMFRGIHAINEYNVVASSTCDVLILSQTALEDVVLLNKFSHVQEAISFVKNIKNTILPDKKHNIIHANLINMIKDHKNFLLQLKDMEERDISDPANIDMGGNGEEKIKENQKFITQEKNNLPVKLISFEAFRNVSFIMIMLWTIFFIPFRAAQFHVESTSIKKSVFPFSLFVDYVFDIFMIYIYHNDIQIESHKNASSVLRFVLTMFPYDLIALFQTDWTMWSILRLSKIVLAIQFSPEFLRSMLKLLSYISIEHFSKIEEVLMTIVALVLVTIHWLSCAWQSINGDASYIRAAYWSLVTISTTGFGELVPNTKAENIISIVAMYIGATIFASLIACLASMQSARITPHNAKYRTQVLLQFCTSICLSEEMKNRVLTYDQHRSENIGDCDQNILLEKTLPDHYRTEMELLIGLNVVQECDLFSKCSIQFQKMVVENLVSCFVSKNEIITTFDKSCPGMFFLMKGRAIMKSSNQKVELEQNSCFGEQSLFLIHDKFDLTNVEAIQHCDLLLLEKEKFARIVENLPDLRLKLSELVTSIHNNKFQNINDTNNDAKSSFQQANELSSTLSHDTKGRLFKHFCTLAPVVLGIYTYLLPFQVAFLINWEISFISVIFDVFAYLVLFIDSAAEIHNHHCNTGARSGVIITDKSNRDFQHRAHEIFNRYSWILNCVALMPWELGTPLLTSNTIGFLQAYAILHLPKLILLHQYNRYLISLQPLLTRFHKICNDQVYTLGALLLLFFTCGHVLACSWFALSVQSTQSAESTWATAFTGLGGFNNRGLLASCLPLSLYGNSSNATAEFSLCFGEPVSNEIMRTWYVSSMYYIFIALTTVGYGDIIAVNEREYLFTICVIILGTLILVFVLAKLEKIVANIDVASTLANRKAETIHEYVKLRKLSLKLESRINEYIELSWKQRRGATMKETMSYLGTRQWEQIVMEKAGNILKSIPVFKDFSIRVLHLIAQKFQPELLLPHQVLFEAEEISDPFYILLEGEIELLEPPPPGSRQDQMAIGSGKKRGRSSVSQTVYMTLEGPCAVCMETFFIEEPRPCTAIGSKSCQLLSLKHSDMIRCLKTDPITWANQKFKVKEIEEELQKMSLVKTMKKNLTSTKLMKMQSMTLAVEAMDFTNRWMCPPNSNFRQIWAILMIFIVVLDLLVFPTRLAFVTSNYLEMFYLIIGTVLDVFYIANVYFNMFRFSIINEDGVMVDKVSMLVHYNIYSLQFYLRLLAALPFQLIAYLAIVSWSQYSYSSYAVLLAITRLPKLLILAQAGGGELENMFERLGIKIDSSFFRTSKMTAAVLVVTHYVACIFLCISSWQTSHTIGGTYVQTAKPGVKYLSAAYWSAYTISTVGYGDVRLQDTESMIFAIGASLIGTVLCGAGLTALLTYWIDGLDQMSGLTHLKQKCVNLYLSHYNYPIDQHNSAQKYLNHMARHQKSIHESYVLSLLPSCLRAEVIYSFTLDATRTFLKKKQWTSNGLLRSLCERMKPYVSSSMEELVILNQLSKRLYILVEGNVSKTNLETNGEQLTTLIKPKTAFGGDFNIPSNFSATSIDISHLYYVNKNTYQKILTFVSGARRSTHEMMRTVTAHDLISNCRRGSTLTKQSNINQLSLFSDR